MIILEENFKWHLEAFASELFIYMPVLIILQMFYSVNVFVTYYRKEMTMTKPTLSVKAKGANPVKASQPAKAKELPGPKTPQVTKGKPNEPKKMVQAAKVKPAAKGSGKLLHLSL